jgi:hypothetical protein
MSTPETPTQFDFIAVCQRLHAAQLEAETPEEREAADHELSHFLRMNAQGRAAEWFTSRGKQE